MPGHEGLLHSRAVSFPCHTRALRQSCGTFSAHNLNIREALPLNAEIINLVAERVQLLAFSFVAAERKVISGLSPCPNSGDPWGPARVH